MERLRRATAVALVFVAVSAAAAGAASTEVRTPEWPSGVVHLGSDQVAHIFIMGSGSSDCLSCVAWVINGGPANLVVRQPIGTRGLFVAAWETGRVDDRAVSRMTRVSPTRWTFFERRRGLRGSTRRVSARRWDVYANGRLIGRVTNPRAYKLREAWGPAGATVL